MSTAVQVHILPKPHLRQQATLNDEGWRLEVFFVFFCPPPNVFWDVSRYNKIHSYCGHIWIKLTYYIWKIFNFFNIYESKRQKLCLHTSAHKIQNDKHMFKYSVCIVIFLFTFCHSAIPLAVPFTVENVRRAQKKCFKIFFRAPSLL